MTLVSKQKDQGTRFESAVVTAAQEHGIPAVRLAEGGGYDLGDVALDLGQGTGLPTAGRWVVLAWKRLVKRRGKRRRSPDGVRDVAVMPLEQALLLLLTARYVRLLATPAPPPHYDSSQWESVQAAAVQALARLTGQLPEGIVVEAKAREQLNVTRELQKAIDKVERIDNGK